MIIGFFSLLAGSAAILSVVQAMPHVVAAMGVLVAMLTYIDVLTNLSGKAALHGEWSKRFSGIKARSAALNLAALDAAMDEVLADTDEDIESLRAVAWNDVLRSNGHEDGMRPETRSQRVARAFA